MKDKQFKDILSYKEGSGKASMTVVYDTVKNMYKIKVMETDEKGVESAIAIIPPFVFHKICQAFYKNEFEQ